MVNTICGLKPRIKFRDDLPSANRSVRPRRIRSYIKSQVQGKDNAKYYVKSKRDINHQIELNNQHDS